MAFYIVAWQQGGVSAGQQEVLNTPSLYQLINIKCEKQVEEQTLSGSIVAGYQQKFW